jgi:hypothetical protein
MNKVIIVIGMPGSGKTTYLRKELGHLPSTDDYYAGSLDGSFYFNKGRDYEKLKDALSRGEDYAISDVEFCRRERLTGVEDGLAKLADELGIEVTREYIYFRNDPTACKHNVLQRYGDRWFTTPFITELTNIDTLTLVYKPTEDRAIPVVDAFMKYWA